MAKLTNRQLDIVIDELVKTISKPIELENKEIVDNYPIKETKFLKDRKKYFEIDGFIDELKTTKQSLVDKYEGSTIDGYKIGRWDGVFSKSTRDNYIKETQIDLNMVLKVSPTRADFEREIILSGNADISELIEKITNKYLSK